MASRRRSGFTAGVLVVLLVSAAFVFSRFGWYAALNSVIPLVIALLWLVALALSAWGAGDLVSRRWLSSDDESLECAVLQLLVGTGTLMAVAGVLGVTHTLGSVTLLIVLGGFGCHGALCLYRQPPPFAAEASFRHHWPWLVMVFAGGLSLGAATTFAPFYDQWHYHLGFPYQWMREGTLTTYARQAYSFFPSNMGLLFVYALAGPGAWAAQVAHWWMGALSAAGSATIARRLGAPTSGQLLAAAIFLATPSVVQLGALAGSDLGVAAFSTGAVIALLRMLREPAHAIRWAAFAGAFAGLAAGTKYLALASVVLPTALAAIVITTVNTNGRNSRGRRTMRAVLAFVVTFTIVVGPWLARNAVQTGNPVHPYFAGVFGDDGNDRLQSDQKVASGIGNYSVTGSTVPIALSLGTFSRRGHAGDIGPVYLWLMPLVVLWMWRRRRDANALLVFGVLVLGVAIWAVGPPLGRYLLPSLALIAAVAGAAWSELVEASGSPWRFVLGLFLVLALAANCNPVRSEYLGDQLACFLGFQSDQEYLQENSTQLDAFRAANSQLPADARVLLVGEPRPYGIDRDIVVEDQFHDPLLVELAEATSSAAEIGQRLRDLGITHLLWNGAEADRIAHADGRDDYLACSSPQARRRLDLFLAEGVTPVVADRWWKIVAVTTG